MPVEYSLRRQYFDFVAESSVPMYTSESGVGFCDITGWTTGTPFVAELPQSSIDPLQRS